jgi:hypothetical protein
MSEHTVVLVAGVPRSGTSWVGRVLGSTAGAAYLSEPDNHGHTPYALRAKLGLPGVFYPRLAPDSVVPAYERLWREAFRSPVLQAPSPVEQVRSKAALRLLRRVSTATVRDAIARPERAEWPVRLASRLAVPERPPPHTGNLVVKTVHAPLALEWIAARFEVRVVVVERGPLSVLSSWKAMGWIGDAPLSELDRDSVRELEQEAGVEPFTGSSSVDEAAHLIGLLSFGLRAASERHPDWSFLTHEALSADAHGSFAALAADLGLGWGAANDRLLDALDRPGSGYETARAQNELGDVWRNRLTPAEVAGASAVLDRFRLRAS